MIDLRKISVTPKANPETRFGVFACGFSLLAIVQDLDQLDQAHPWSLAAKLLIGALLIAVLGVLIAPPRGLRTLLGVPSSRWARLCLGTTVLLGLVGWGLPFAQAWIGDVFLRMRFLDMREDLTLALLITGSCAGFILDGRVPTHLTRRVVGLHLFVAFSMLVSCAVNYPQFEPRRFPPPWPVMVSWTSGFVFLLLMAIYLHKHRPRKGHCAVCNYNLTGNVSGRCPECGTPIAAGTETAAPPGPAEVKKTE